MNYLFNKTTSSKDKTKKERKVNTNTKVVTALETAVKDEENRDAKEVLQLFNKIEEMVVDGDPRVREALYQKPGIQNLLRDDSSLYGLSPRSAMGQMMPAPNSNTLVKEETNTSLLSQRKHFTQNKHFSQRHPGVPIQSQTFNRSPRKNIVVPPIVIPEHSTLGDTFSNGYHTALIKQHPDGTLQSTRVENAVITETTKNQQPVVPQPTIQYLPIEVKQPIRITQQQISPVVHTRPTQQLLQQKRVQKAKKVTSPRYHSFIYDTGTEKTTVSIHMQDNNIPEETKTEPNKKQSAIQVAAKPDFESLVNFKPQMVMPQPEFTAIPISQNTNPASATKRQQTAVYSKVMGEEGGAIICFGCKLQVPKNAVAKKSLFRISILDISQIPHKTDRLFYHTNNDIGSTLMAIAPAINVTPIDTELLMPVTIQLPTCIAVQEQSEQNSEQGLAETYKDIKADNIIIKLRNKNTKELWTDTDTEVFRSSDSVIFKTQELGDLCAFYSNQAVMDELLTKRLAVFLFKSLENRKKQFISILITEDLPHVIQKGIESMPQWLKYTDSCSNITMPEGKNLVIYIEALDRTKSSVDANKMDIPWENLWYPECIIRKHVHVTLFKQEARASVRVYLDDGRAQLNSDFIWKTKYQRIHMPDLMTTNEEPDNIQDGSWENGTDNAQMEQELLKKVTWKPPTPAPKYVTNKGLLTYATMQE